MATGKPCALFWRILWRSLSVKRAQAGVALASLAVGAAVTSMLLNLYGDVRRKMTREFRAYGANLVLAPRAATPAREMGPSVSGLMEANHWERVRALSLAGENLSAVPLLYVVARLQKYPPTDPRLPQFENVVTVGSDFSALHSMYAAWRLRGRSPSDQKHCVVGNQVARELHLMPGDTVELEFAGRTGPERRRFLVEAVLTTGSSEDGQVFLPLEVLQRTAGLEGRISLVELSVRGDTPEIEAAAAQLASAFPDLEVRPLRQIIYSEGRVLQTLRWLLIALTALILSITGLCVMATMTAIVLDRRREIGIMKALGGSDRLVMNLFLVEAAGLGLLGALTGFGLGAGLARWAGLKLFGVPLGLSWPSLPLVLLTGLAVALLATSLPVRMVRRVRPAVILRGE